MYNRFYFLVIEHSYASHGPFSLMIYEFMTFYHVLPSYNMVIFQLTT